MNITSPRSALRSYVSEHPSSWLAMMAQWQRRYLHEPDFALFGHLADLPGLVVDVGANRGQSALSILRTTSKLNVVSFEPNPALRHCLFTLKALHPRRFSFHLVALGNSSGDQQLWIPHKGNEALHPQASLNRQEFSREVVAQRLASDGVDIAQAMALRPVSVNLNRLDSFCLKPDLIKIDAEGSEADVLRGAGETIRGGFPALMIEVNEPGNWLPALLADGYELFAVGGEGRFLEPLDSADGQLNIICLHHASESPLAMRLLSMVRRG